MATAAILTIGNELVSGDVPNTNGSWLAKRLALLGVETRLLASVPDEIEPIAELILREAPLVDFFIVTGGLGGTPDDLTREALAHTFDAPQEERPDLAAELRARFVGDPEYAVRWAALPRGARPIPNPLGGAPGFIIENVYVPIGSWRRTYHTRESVIAPALVEVGERWPGVLVGSYPTFGPDGPTVEVVVKSSDPDDLRDASSWLELALEQRS